MGEPAQLERWAQVGGAPVPAIGVAVAVILLTVWTYTVIRDDGRGSTTMDASAGRLSGPSRNLDMVP